MRIGFIDYGKTPSPAVLFSCPGVWVGGLDRCGGWAQLLISRGAMREPSLVFTPVAVAGSVPSVARFRRTERTFRVNPQVQLRSEPKRPCCDMCGNPKRCRSLGRPTIFLGLFLFEPPHPRVRQVRRRVDRASLIYAHVPHCRPFPVGCPTQFKYRYHFRSLRLIRRTDPFHWSELEETFASSKELVR